VESDPFYQFPSHMGTREPGKDVIDVEAEEVHTPEPLNALPSSVPDAAEENKAKLWERWTAMGRGAMKKS
jgi:hypothetical protein